MAESIRLFRVRHKNSSERCDHGPAGTVELTTEPTSDLNDLTGVSGRAPAKRLLTTMLRIKP
jgi:hypothetical protein